MLRAALLPGDAGKEAAQNWLASADFQKLGKASRGILPLLYTRLRQEGFPASLMPVLKGIKRHTWYNNRRLFHHGGAAVRALREAGIDVMVIKGAAMVIDYYHDESLRPMEDLDILVRYSDRRDAIRLLMQHGWAPNPQHYRASRNIEELTSEIGKSVHLVQPTGLHLDLHWNLTHYCLGDATDDDFWASAGECMFEGQVVKVLSPADQLLHIIAHGAPWSTISPVRWIPDAITVLNHHPEFDWDRLTEQARQKSLAFMTRNALRYLDGHFCSVPSRVLSALDRTSTRAFERIEHWNFSQPGSGGLLRSILRVLSDYLRYSRTRSLLQTVGLMPRYLRIRFAAKNLPHLIVIVLVKSVRRFSVTKL